MWSKVKLFWKGFWSELVEDLFSTDEDEGSREWHLNRWKKNDAQSICANCGYQKERHIQDNCPWKNSSFQLSVKAHLYD